MTTNRATYMTAAAGGRSEFLRRAAASTAAGVAYAEWTEPAPLDAVTAVQLATTPAPSFERGLLLVEAASQAAAAAFDRHAAADVFAKLVREVDAGRALIAMTPQGERHRAAVDALSLARDVLADARDLFGPCACGRIMFDAASDLGGSYVDAEMTAHAPVACVRLDETGGQL